MDIDRSRMYHLFEESIYWELRTGKDDLDYWTAQEARGKISEDAKFTDLSSAEGFQERVLRKVVDDLTRQGLVEPYYIAEKADTVGGAIDKLLKKA